MGVQGPLQQKHTTFMAKNRNKNISIHAQIGRLRYFFPDSTYLIIRYGKGFIWKVNLQPSNLSPCYEIKIEYVFEKNPDVFVTNPIPLPLADGEDELPHVYDHTKQHLCLYYRRDKEWTPNKMIADTILPWISEWLLHYEYWLITGEWRGGGIEHKIVHRHT